MKKAVKLLSLALPRRKDDPALRFLSYFMLPLWTASGMADYLCHRRARIETTSGSHESMMHLLMMAEAGPPILAALFFEVDAGVLAAMFAAAIIHFGTAIWDVAYTVDKRKVPDAEQHVHVFLESLPFFAAFFAASTHWEQFKALFGAGRERPRFAMRPRRPPLPLRYTVPLVAAAGLMNVLPHMEEYWRCRNAERDGQGGRDTPECLRELYGAGVPLARGD